LRENFPRPSVSDAANERTERRKGLPVYAVLLIVFAALCIGGFAGYGFFLKKQSDGRETVTPVIPKPTPEETQNPPVNNDALAPVNPNEESWVTGEILGFWREKTINFTGNCLCSFPEHPFE
jgi:hypothetical protein